MADFNATAGVDNYTGDATDETVFFDPGDIQAGDFFDGGLGFNTLQLEGPLGAGTYNWDFSVIDPNIAGGLQNFSALVFNPDSGASPASTFMNAFFFAEQFGVGLLDTAFSVTGSTLSTDAITVTLSVGGAFSAEDWIFTTWTGADLLTINGTGDDDTLTGSTEADVINGGAGSDFLDGGNSVDTLVGGDGDDSYVYDGADTLTEQANEGLDTVYSNVAGVTLGANFEDLQLLAPAGAGSATGNSLANTITGNASANTIDGGAGADTLIGQGGNDTYIVDDAGDTVTEGAAAGTDTVESSVTFTLGANIENLTLTGSGNINGTGNTQNNTIIGNSGNNTLDGSTGADAMSGLGGNDTYTVDDAGDTASEAGGGGTDTVNSTVSFTLGADIENLNLLGANNINGTGNAGANTITGNSGNNTIDGSTGIDTLIGGAGDDTYVIADGDTITELGGGGTDLVQASISHTLASEVENLTLTGVGNINGTGNSLANTITGNSGNNTLDGSTGIDTLIGGAGDDTYIIADGDTITELGGGGTDTVQSSITHTLASEVENLVLTGTADINGTGNGLANSITGNSGANTIDGGAGADAMAGGGGNDTYVVDNASDAITEGAGGGTDQVNSSVDHTLASEVENLTLTGAAIAGTGNSLANTIIGTSSNNTIDGAGGADAMIGGAGDDTYVVDNASDAVTEIAGGGSDTVNASVSYTLASEVESLVLTGVAAINGTGNALGNSISGNTAANVIDGGAGADAMIGGAGDDTYVVDNASDSVTELGGGGTDTVQSSVTHTLASEVENLTLTGSGNINGTGNGGDNVINGNSGNNTLDGGAGTDTLAGGAGDDIYIINDGDSVSEFSGEGTDTVQSSLSYLLNVEVENLTLTGAADINGTGNSLANVITGNTGANILDGGAGIDTLIGGAGNDTYIIADADTVTELGGGGTDNAQASISYTLAAEVEDLTLTGVAAISGTGNSLANTITGNSAANTLDGGAGIDTLIGGDGDDTYVIADGDTITELALGGTDLVQASISYTLGSELENLTLTGSGNINGTGNSGDNVINGNSGNNTLDGGAGTDTLAGGAGDDIYIINDGDSVSEFSGEGTDTVQSSLSYVLGVEVENLTLTGTLSINGTGNSGANTITGNSGDNQLDGGLGADAMAGGLGSDIYIVDDLGDTVSEAGGDGGDLVNSSVSFTLGAGLESLTLTGAGNIDGTGNGDFNVIVGNIGDNILDGAGGDDLLFGAAGADALVGGLGTDTASYSGSAAVNVNLATNTATGGDAAGDTFNSVENLTGSDFGDTLTGDSAANTIVGGAGADAMAGGAGDDTFEVDEAGDTASENASEGTDTVRSAVTFVLGANIENLVLLGATNINGTGNALANTLTGNAGNNVLDGGTGVDTMIGGAGDDTYHANVIGDVATELLGEGTDHVIAAGFYTLGANVENLTLTGVGATSGTGNTLDNVIIGNGAVNILTGLAGNDTLNGGVGADQMYGGEGDDLYIVDNAADFTFEANFAWGTDTVQASVAYTLGQNIDNLTLMSGVINGTGNNIANVLTGNTLANIFFGLGGNDTLNGGVGADQMYAGEGDDTYFVDNVADVAYEAQFAWGTDTVISSVTYSTGTNIDNLTLAAGAGAINGNGNALNNVITGNESVNTLFGFLGNDTLNGGVGADQMYGGEGDDAYVVDNAGDVVFESSAAWGTDTVTSSVNYTLTTNIDNLVLATGATTGQGNATANTITGNSSANTLRGFGGNDVLNGGAGNDVLNGGLNDDTFVFGPGTGQDRVADFVAGGVDDTLDLSAYNGSGVTWSITQVGADTVFTFTNGDEITLTNVTSANLVVIDPFHYG